MFRNSALQVGSELPFDEKRHGTDTLLLPGEECFELFGDDLIQNAFFRMARSVFKRCALHAH